MNPALGFELAWALWAVSWIAAAFWSAPTVSRPKAVENWGYRLVLIAGAIFLYHRTSDRLQAMRLWHVGLDGAWALVAVAIAGFLFTWWARIHLGKLWSGNVTRKEGHRIVDTGPYGLVRHPIYTGLIAATIATAAAEATWPALLGAALLVLGMWMKARLEERFLSHEIGGDYSEYAKRVPMLIPFGPI